MGIVPQIMYEVVRFYDRVESEYDREILLRLLPPWILQFSTVTNKIKDNQSCREMTYAFIVKLYELTNKAKDSIHQSSKQLNLSYILWCNLALSTPDLNHFENGLNKERAQRYNEMVISEIVKYMISRYTLHYNDEHEICSKILEKICSECLKNIRTNDRKKMNKTNLYLLGQCLGKSLH